MKIGDAPVPVHEKMVKFLPTYYLELDKISPTENLASDDDDINDIWILDWILALLHSRKINVFDKKYFTYSIIYCIKLLIQLTKIIPMQRYNMYDHAYKISKFGKFDLFARTIIRAVLKFAPRGARKIVLREFKYS